MIANPISSNTIASTTSTQTSDTVSGKAKTHGINNTALSDAIKSDNAANKSRETRSADIVIPRPRTGANVEAAKKIIDYFKENNIAITQENLQQFIQSLAATSKPIGSYFSTQLADPVPPDGDLPPIDAPTPQSFLYGVPTNVDPSIEMFAGLIALVLQMMEASTALKSANAELIVSAAKFQSAEIVKQGNLEVSSAWISGFTAVGIAGAGALSNIRSAHVGVTGSSHHDVWKNHEQAGMDKIRFKDSLAGTHAIEVQNFNANRANNPDSAIPAAPPMVNGRVGDLPPELVGVTIADQNLQAIKARHVNERTAANAAVDNHDDPFANDAHPFAPNGIGLTTKAEAIANQISGQRSQAIGNFLAQTVSHVIKGGIEGSFKAAESAAQADATEYAASGTLGNSLMDSSSQSKVGDDSLVTALLNILKSFLDNKTATQDTMKI